ncbi:MAG: branched-chain amino acid ABC transporter permease [Bradyrhizobiaceae bacterium]|nr:branched-chain amino acid ABC transporter permease [Bradyrhizobiaceae bacterium]
MTTLPTRSGLAELSAQGRLGLAWHALPWVLAFVVFYMAEGYLSLWTNALIMILLTLSLDLALGYAGIVTLGQAAFFGFGAYAAGLFAIHVHNDPLIGLVTATALSGLFGFVTGILILHTQGVTLLMLTLAVAGLLAEWANRAYEITGGDDGLQGVRMGPVLGLFRFDLYGKTAYLYSLAVLFVWFVVVWRIIVSPFGRSLDGIRQNPARMRAIGTPVWWRLVAIYTISAAMAGTAGALSAQTTRFVGLTTLSVLVSGTALVMLMLGGTRRIYGAFLGATVYVIVQDYAAKVNPFYWMFFIGALLMATVLFLEGGLMDLGATVRKYWRRAPVKKP